MDFSAYEDPKPEISLVSLVDVILQLVIFFALTTHFGLQTGLDVQLPKASPTEVERPAQLAATVTKEGRIFLEDREVPVEELKAELEERLPANPQQRLLVIRADSEARHGRVVKVMDLAKQAGFHRLAIATEPEGSQSKPRGSP